MPLILIIIVIVLGVIIYRKKKFEIQKKIYVATNSIESNFKTISHAEIKSLLDSKKAILLDVRNIGELVTDGYIDGTINIPLKQLETRLSELDKNQAYIVFCAVGGRSQKAADILIKNGFKTVFNAAEGIKTWPFDKKYSNS